MSTKAPVLTIARAPVTSSNLKSIGRHFGQHVRNKFKAVDLASLADNDGSEAD